MSIKSYINDKGQLIFNQASITGANAITINDGWKNALQGINSNIEIQDGVIYTTGNGSITSNKVMSPYFVAPLGEPLDLKVNRFSIQHLDGDHSINKQAIYIQPNWIINNEYALYHYKKESINNSYFLAENITNFFPPVTDNYNITIAFWLYSDDQYLGQEYISTIFKVYNINDENIYYEVRRIGSCGINIRWQNQNETQLIEGNFVFSNSYQWHYIVIGVELSTNYIYNYVDGINVSTILAGCGIVGNIKEGYNALQLFSSEGEGNLIIDELIIWKRLLNYTEIVEEYNKRRYKNGTLALRNQLYPEDVLLALRFEEGNGNIIEDTVAGITFNKINNNDATYFITNVPQIGYCNSKYYISSISNNFIPASANGITFAVWTKHISAGEVTLLRLYDSENNKDYLHLKSTACGMYVYIHTIDDYIYENWNYFSPIYEQYIWQTITIDFTAYNCGMAVIKRARNSGTWAYYDYGIDIKNIKNNYNTIQILQDNNTECKIDEVILWKISYNCTEDYFFINNCGTLAARRINIRPEDIILALRFEDDIVNPTDTIAGITFDITGNSGNIVSTTDAPYIGSNYPINPSWLSATSNNFLGDLNEYPKGITIAFWVKINEIGNKITVFKLSNSIYYNEELHDFSNKNIKIEIDGQELYYNWRDTESRSGQTSLSILPNTWTHVVVSFVTEDLINNQCGTFVYKNGILESYQTLVNFSTMANDYDILEIFYGSDDTGFIDELMIWNIRLSANDIYNMYNTPSNSGTVASYTSAISANHLKLALRFEESLSDPIAGINFEIIGSPTGTVYSNDIKQLEPSKYNYALIDFSIDDTFVAIAPSGFFINSPEITFRNYNGNKLYKFPTNVGSAGQVMVNDGYGNLYWDYISNNPSNVWTLIGNSGTNSNVNFIGTIDNVNFNIKVNNNKIASFDTKGNIVLGNNNEFLNNTINSAFNNLFFNARGNLTLFYQYNNIVLGEHSYIASNATHNFIYNGYVSGVNDAHYNVLIGGVNNKILTANPGSVSGAVVIGGNNNNISLINSYYNNSIDYSAIIGGINNNIGINTGNCQYSGIFVGENNAISASKNSSIIAGNNNCIIGSDYSIVLGYGASANNHFNCFVWSSNISGTSTTLPKQALFNVNQFKIKGIEYIDEGLFEISSNYNEIDNNYKILQSAITTTSSENEKIVRAINLLNNKTYLIEIKGTAISDDYINSYGFTRKAVYKKVNNNIESIGNIEIYNALSPNITWDFQININENLIELVAIGDNINNINWTITVFIQSV